MSYKNFLDDDVVLTIRPQFAALLGLNESIVIQQVHYWLKKAEKGQCGKYKDGHYWVWNTNPEWLEQFPFFSESTLKRIFARLKSEGIVLIKQYEGSNRVNFYRIDYKKLDEFLENAQNSHEVKMTSCEETPTGQSDPLEEVNMAPSSGHIDPMYITEITPETTQTSEEEEVCVGEIVETTSSLHQFVIPLAMEHLPALLIEQAIDRAVSKLAKRSPAGYRKALMKGLAAGDESWIAEVFEFVKQVQATTEAPWERDKRLKREAGEAGQHVFREAGFDNLLDFLENREGGVA